MRHGTLIDGTGSNFFFFNTVDTDGAPITLAGSPSLACNINGGTAATAGLTLSVDHGTVTGKHRVAIDVDNATLALVDGDVVEVYIAAGTVDAVSVVGAVVGVFTISDGSLLAQTLTDIDEQVDTAISNAALATAAAATAIEADTQDIQSRLPAALNNGAMPADVQRVNDVALVGDGSATPFNV
jgi:hypothetical protein